MIAIGIIGLIMFAILLIIMAMRMFIFIHFVDVYEKYQRRMLPPFPIADGGNTDDGTLLQ